MKYYGIASYNSQGQLVPLTTKRSSGLPLRQELARIVQRPEGVGAAPAKVGRSD